MAITLRVCISGILILFVWRKNIRNINEEKVFMLSDDDYLQTINTYEKITTSYGKQRDDTGGKQK